MDNQYPRAVLLPDRYGFCDCKITIKCADGLPVELRCHRSILANAPYFKGMFKNTVPIKIEQEGTEFFAIYPSIEVYVSSNTAQLVIECLYNRDKLKEAHEYNAGELLIFPMFLCLPREEIEIYLSRITSDLLADVDVKSETLLEFLLVALGTGIEMHFKMALLSRMYGFYNINPQRYRDVKVKHLI